MKTRIELIGVVLVFGLLCYGLLMNLILSCLASFVFLVLMFGVILPHYNRVKKAESKEEEINQLIHHILIQLGATPSLFTALSDVSNFMTEDLAMNLQEDLPLEDRIQQINGYYQHKYLQFFLQSLLICHQKGGDYFTVTDLIVEGMMHEKYYRHRLKIVKLQKLYNLFSLWGLSFIVLIYLRFGLSSYYLDLLNLSFIWVIIAVLGGFMASLVMGFSSYSSTIKEI